MSDNLPHAELVAALRGQDALISAIGFGSIAAEEKLIAADIEAKVKRFFPSEYGVNNTFPAARALCPVFDGKGAIIDLLRTKEVSGLSWTAVPTYLWLEWTLDPTIAFANIDIKAHTAKLWQNGTHSLSWSTIPWSAEGIVQTLLADPTSTANKVIPLHGVSASQNDIITLLEKIQGVKYEISNFNDTATVEEAQKSWAENNDTKSALDLVKVGFSSRGMEVIFRGRGLCRMGMSF